MGGLHSFAALFWRNDCLRRAGGQSGAYWFGSEMMPARVRSAPPVSVVRAYLDNGAPDDNSRFVHDMRDALQSRGYPVYHWENQAQLHTWEAWASRFDEALAARFPPWRA
jgi:hypothetical protein